MADIFTQDVSVWATVGGQDNFQVISVETTRRTGREIGQAVLKGIPEDGDVYPAPGGDVEVFIATESAENPWDEDLNSSRNVFYGEIMSAKQTKEGLIVFEVSGMRDLFHRKTVKLEVETPTHTYTVLKGILEDAFGTVHSDIEDATPFEPYLADVDEFSGNYQRTWRFGNAERGLPLIDAIEDLLNSLGGTMWVDRSGIIRIEPIPERTEWRTPLITEIEAGESTRNVERVIFEASGTASELGQGASFVYNQTGHNSRVDIKGAEDEPDAPSRTLSDDNVSSQEEADQQAFNAAVSEDQNRDLGKITIIGNAEIELYDEIIVPELEYIPSEHGVNLSNQYQTGRYNVDGIIHKVDASNGFLTTIELSPPLDESINRCNLSSVPSKSGFQQDVLSQYDNSLKEERISFTDNGEEDGGLIDLGGLDFG